MIDLEKLHIDKAIDTDYNILTDIAFTAKKHLNYPDNYFDTWRDELTITKDYIKQNIVYKAIYFDSVVGFYSIVENKSDFYSGEIWVQGGFWLDHIFIKPDFHKIGIERIMIDHAKIVSKNSGILDLMILVDPFV